jgi:hypothetical protein
MIEYDIQILMRTVTYCHAHEIASLTAANCAKPIPIVGKDCPQNYMKNSGFPSA